MKVTVKTIKNEESSYDVDPTDTVLSLKEKIAADKGTTSDAIKIIFSGKPLRNDTATLESCNINNNSKLIIMISRKAAAPAPAPAPAAQPVTPAAAPAPTVPPATPVKPATSAPAEERHNDVTATPTTTTTTSAAPAPAPAAAAVGGASEEVISRLCEMGFERNDVTRALRASFGNADRAVEYLMTGIPDIPGIDDVNMAPNEINDNRRFEAGSDPMRNFIGGSNAGGGAFPMPGVVDENAGGANEPEEQQQPGQEGEQGQQGLPNSQEMVTIMEQTFGQLAQNGQFRTICQMAKQNPQLLSQVIQIIDGINPDLGRLYRSNPTTFARLINNIDNVPVIDGGFPMGGADDEGGDSDMDQDDHDDHDDHDHHDHGAGGIQMTPEDREAIGRLAGLGFDPSLCAQAYFACDKNESLAANWLLDHGFD